MTLTCNDCGGPLRLEDDNAAYECVYVDGNPQNAHKPGKCYDFPSARLMPLPVDLAWRDAEVGDL